jgi:hypothetical protein
VRIVIDHWPQKDDPNRVCITIVGNFIDYPYKLTTRSANMVSSKIMWNSIISMPNTKFGGTNIKNMYLKTPLDQCGCVKMPLRQIPNDIIEHYGLHKKAIDGMSAWKSERVCTASHKSASLPTSSSNFVLHAMDLNSPTHLASENTSHNRSGSTCAWTTLAPNRLVTPETPFCCPLGGDVQHCQRLDGQPLLWYLSCMEL